MKLSKNEQEKVSNMRRQGFGYRRIAKFLDLDTMAVKYYLEKTWDGDEKIVSKVPISELCPNCGLPVVQTPHKRKKIYCSDKCRLQAWQKANCRYKKKMDIDSNVDAVFLPGKIHSYEDVIYIIYLVAEANKHKGAWEIEIIDAERILKVYEVSGGDEEKFFDILPDWFHGEWRFCHEGSCEVAALRKAYMKADFVVGLDGDIHDEMMFLVKWAQEHNTLG